MKIAGVGVNLKCLPTKEQLIEQALTTKEFYQKKNALKLIEAEIKASGLFNTNSDKVKNEKSKPKKHNRRTRNSE